MTTLPSGSPAQAQRHIRFVNNQGQPPSKRPRIEAACLTCRRRKTRCSGDRPLCSTCVKNGHECLGYSDLLEKKPIGKKGDQTGRAIPSNTRRRDATGFNDLDDDFANEEALEDDGRNWNKPKPKGQKKRASFVDTCEETGHLRESSNASDLSNRPGGDRGSDWEPNSRRSSFPVARQASYSEDGRCSSNRSPSQHQHRPESRRVPFFRYFGNTAINPGYKQTSVRIRASSNRERRRSRGGSFSTTSPGSLINNGFGYHQIPPRVPILENLDDLPVYGQNGEDDSVPTHPLIISLVKTFFHHLGCNYPFLREERCLRQIKDKSLEPILVDAMCCLAARFSDLPIFTNERDGPTNRSEYSHVFAQRARNATVDTFPCPSLAAVQACLLMAYEGFGSNQDSSLWMYLGIAIRMAVDIGLGKHVGIKYEGGSDPWYMRGWARKDSDGDLGNEDAGSDGDCSQNDTRQDSRKEELEKERVDTFWAVFVLDRVISSGTGRPVTFRDDDFELDLPEPSCDPVSGRPDPFPIFIRIIHLYGRVSDIFNNVKRTEDLTSEKLAKTAELETELIKLYQGLDNRLSFTAVNFQEAVKANQGTSFVLLHFWFHALVIMLHQPTLLPFGNMGWASLLPKSRELSMSSAKTIADILQFAQFVDPFCFCRNPFTSQPIYIAACSFLSESFSNAPVTPPAEDKQSHEIKTEPSMATRKASSGGASVTAKHSLLASAASNNYQTCYKSLQTIHRFWEGVEYILLALDLKARRLGDVEALSAKAAKGIRRESLSRFPNEVVDKVAEHAEAPPSPSVPVVGLTFTGTTNSPNTNIAVLRLNTHAASHSVLKHSAPPQPQLLPPPAPSPTSAPTPPGNMIYDPIRQDVPESPFQSAFPQPNVSAVRSPINPSKMSQMPTPSSTTTSVYTEGRSMSNQDRAHMAEEVDQGSPAHESKLHILAGVTAQQAGHGFNVPQFVSSSRRSSVYPSSVAQGESPRFSPRQQCYPEMSQPQPPHQPQSYPPHDDNITSGNENNVGTGSSSANPDNDTRLYPEYWPDSTNDYSLPGATVDLITTNYGTDVNLENLAQEARDPFFDLNMFLPSESFGGASSWVNQHWTLGS